MNAYYQQIINTINAKTKSVSMSKTNNGFYFPLEQNSSTLIIFQSQGSSINLTVSHDSRIELSLEVAFDDIKPIVTTFFNDYQKKFSNLPKNIITPVKEFLINNEYQETPKGNEQAVKINDTHNSKIYLSRLLYSGSKIEVHMLTMVELLIGYVEPKTKEYYSEILYVPGFEISKYPFLKPWLDIKLTNNDNLEEKIRGNKFLQKTFNLDVISEKEQLIKNTQTSKTQKNLHKI